MTRLVFDSLVTFPGVFLGLFALWSFLEFMTPKQRLINATIAGAFSVFVTTIITATISATIMAA